MNIRDICKWIEQASLCNIISIGINAKLRLIYSVTTELCCHNFSLYIKVYTIVSIYIYIYIYIKYSINSMMSKITMIANNLSHPEIYDILAILN